MVIDCCANSRYTMKSSPLSNKILSQLTEQDFHYLLKEICRYPGFRQRNPHLTDEDIAQLHLNDNQALVFGDKPYLATCPCGGERGARPYPELWVRHPLAGHDGTHIKCNRIALAYRLKTQQHLEGEQLLEALQTNEASHMFFDFVGSTRDFNWQNIVPETPQTQSTGARPRSSRAPPGAARPPGVVGS
jgi:hypothetical protein